jgi:hypothetical protein
MHYMLLIACCCGIATALEHAKIVAEKAPTERGDLLVALPEEGLVTTDVSVVRPAVSLFSRQYAGSHSIRMGCCKHQKDWRWTGGCRPLQFTLHGVISSETGSVPPWSPVSPL